MTAFSDETGRGWLPLKYEDGPDFCTVTFATGAAFALTVHPERMKLMEAALSASPVAQEPVATKKVYIKPLRTIVEIQTAYADQIRDWLNASSPAIPAGVGADEIARAKITIADMLSGTSFPLRVGPWHEEMASKIVNAILAILSRDKS